MDIMLCERVKGKLGGSNAFISLPELMLVTQKLKSLRTCPFNSQFPLSCLHSSVRKKTRGRVVSSYRLSGGSFVCVGLNERGKEILSAPRLLPA